MRNHLVFLTWSGSITKWSHLHRVGGICSWSASDLQVQEANHPRNSGMEMSSNQNRRSGHALINDGKFKGKERRWAHWLKNLSKKNGKATVLGSSIKQHSCIIFLCLQYQPSLTMVWFPGPQCRVDLGSMRALKPAPTFSIREALFKLSQTVAAGHWWLTEQLWILSVYLR